MCAVYVLIPASTPPGIGGTPPPKFRWDQRSRELCKCTTAFLPAVDFPRSSLSRIGVGQLWSILLFSVAYSQSTHFVPTLKPFVVFFFRLTPILVRRARLIGFVFPGGVRELFALLFPNTSILKTAMEGGAGLGFVYKSVPN